ncbi:MAG TPA: hypothetical protein VE991_08910 [Acidimicrobiales bacterium]|nr:hypothetical protein [Acidimicrobiales bacterium]
MGVGTSIVIFAIGAVLRFAVSVSSTSVNLHTIGVILMIVGAVGFVLSLFFWSSWGGFGGGRYRERTIVDRGPGYAGPAGGSNYRETEIRS